MRKYYKSKEESKNFKHFQAMENGNESIQFTLMPTGVA